jgi:hypothetical protein
MIIYSFNFLWRKIRALILHILAKIGKYSAIFAAIYANAPNFRELGLSSALAACTSKVDRNDRALVKLNSAAFRTLRMLAEKYFCTSQLYNRRHALQWKSCALGNPTNAGVCR